MRSDGDGATTASAQRAQKSRGDTQLRRCTTPEQITRCRGHNCNVGTELSDLRNTILIVPVEQMPVEHEYAWTVAVERGLCVPQGRRQMRVTATEVTASFESPG